MVTSPLFALFILATMMTSSLVEGSGRKEDERNKQKIALEDYLKSIQKRVYERVESNSNMLKADEHPRPTRNQVSPEIRKEPAFQPRPHLRSSHEKDETTRKKPPHTLQLKPGESLDTIETARPARDSLHTLQLKPSESLDKIETATPARESLHMVKLKPGEFLEKERTAGNKHIKHPHLKQHRRDVSLEKKKIARMERYETPHTLQHGSGESLEMRKTPRLERMELPHTLQHRSGESLEMGKTPRLERMELPHTSQHRRGESLEKEKKARMERKESPHRLQFMPRVSLEIEDRFGKIEQMKLPYSTQPGLDRSLNEDGALRQEEMIRAGNLLLRMHESARALERGRISKQISPNEPRIINLEPGRISNQISPKEPRIINLESGRISNQISPKKTRIVNLESGRISNQISPKGHRIINLESGRVSNQISSKERRIINLESSSSQSKCSGISVSDSLEPPVVPADLEYSNNPSRHCNNIIYGLEGGYDPDYIQITDNSGNLWGSEPAVQLSDDHTYIPDPWPRSPSPSTFSSPHIPSPKPRGYEYTDHEPTNKKTNYSTMFRDTNDKRHENN